MFVLPKLSKYSNASEVIVHGFNTWVWRNATRRG